MVPYEKARTKTVWCVVCINLRLIFRRRKGFHNSHMREERAIYLIIIFHSYLELCASTY